MNIESDKNNQETNDAKNEAINFKKIIPAYEKKGKIFESNKNKSKKFKKEIRNKKRILKSKISIIILIAIILLVIAIPIILNFCKIAKYNKLYKKYEEPIRMYGFEKVYDNGSAKTTEHVTKSELIKMVISATLNTSQIDKYIYEASDDYSNCKWIDYAVVSGLIQDSEITKENADEIATYGDVLKYFSDAKSKILKLELNTNEDKKINKINLLSSDKQIALRDMVNNDIISLNGKNINENSKAIKGEVNEIISNYVLKYNTITVGDDKVNINQDNVPSNEKEYPYIVASVDKGIYETGFKVSDESRKSNPKDMYKDTKEVYSQIGNYVEDYYSNILNIDYNTIDEKTFKESLEEYSLYSIDDEIVSEYVKYVKDNKIIIEGKATVQYPIIYSDGMKTRVRTKVEFEVKSSNTKNNLLYLDLAKSSSNIVYGKNKYVIYIDNEMGIALGENTASLYNYDTCVYDMLLENYKDGITRE